MTKNEIKAILTAAGIAFPAKGNLETLTALLPVEQVAPEVVTPEEQAVLPVAPEAPVAPAATPESTGLKIEKDRPEQHGIKRPSIGGKCRAIWDALDEYRAETGELPTSKTVKELAADSGWNPNNASIEYYQWRKYNGIAKG